MEDRLRDYFDDYSQICPYKMLGTYEIFILDIKLYSDDTRDLFIQFEDLCKKTNEDKLCDFLEEMGY